MDFNIAFGDVRFKEVLDYNSFNEYIQIGFNIWSFKEIGVGFFTDARKAEWNNKVIVAKRYFNPDYDDLVPEKWIDLLIVNNENILKLYGFTKSRAFFNPQSFVLMEYADCGSMYQLLHGSKVVQYHANDALHWMHQCAKGLSYLHAIKPHSIVHKRIRPKNLFLHNNLTKLKIDLICIAEIENEDKMIAYRAPEVNDQGSGNYLYEDKIDVYSFGRVFWEILTRRRREFPFEIPLPLTSENVRLLLQSCLDLDPRNRPNMDTIASRLSNWLRCSLSEIDSLIGQNISFNIADIELGKVLGSGAFGVVYLGQLHQIQYAVKKCIFDESATKEAFEREAKYLSQATHANIIKLFGTGLSTDSRTLIVMEFADCGTLYNYLHTKENQMRKYTFLAALNWMHQLAQGIEYLHSKKPRPIIHRDIKTKNLLLVNKYRTLKIGDFGTVAEQATSTMTNNVGTAQYKAPEISEGIKYTEKSDIYSFGIVFWEVMSQKKPFYHLGNNDYLAIINLVNKGKRPPIDDIKNYPNREHIKALIERCWHQTPENRSSMTDLAFILGIDFSTSDFNSINLKKLPETSDVDYS